MNAIFHRVSIRKYEYRPVEREKIVTMLRAAMAAPSAGNGQPWEYYVVRNKQKMEELSATSPYAKFAKDAPLMFVACYRKRDSQNATTYALQDMSASVENLLLEADVLGLGAVWMGVAPEKDRMDAICAVLSVPDHLAPFAMIACGYPAESRPQQDRYDESRVHYVP